MEVQAYLKKMKSLQKGFISFISSKTKEEEETHQNLIQLLDDYKIKENQSDFKMFLRLITKIADNDQHLPNYFNKITSVIDHIKNEIKQTFSNQEIFDIFRSNKRIILFLIKSNIISFDEALIPHLKKVHSYSDYLPFFYPELKPFLTEKEIEKYSKEITDDFEEKRQIGENDDYISELIRNDKIDEFIAYINKNKIEASSKLKFSIFETNKFITIKSMPHSGSSTLIEYAAYFGSVQIFKYLYSHNVQMKAKLLTYSIHGSNTEIFHLLEKNKSLLDPPKKKGYSAFKNEFGEFDYDIEDLLHFNSKRTIREKCLIEAIRCHHNELVRYILKKWFKKKDESLIISKSVQSLNFEFIEEYFNCEDTFYYLCKHNYYALAVLLLKGKNINVSKKAIQRVYVLTVMFNKFFFNKISVF